MSAPPTVGVTPGRRANALRRSWSPRRGLLLAGIVALAIFFSVVTDDWLNVANYTMIFAIAALGLNVLSGYAGQVSLGIAFFMGIGAYTAAGLGSAPPTTPGGPLGLGLSFVIWLPAAGARPPPGRARLGPRPPRPRPLYLWILSLALI